MNKVIGECPICSSKLEVRRLSCRSCDTTIDGHFSLGRLYRLQTEQLEFVETFVRCEGKIKHVEAELGLSYPAVRSRLESIIKALGHEVGAHVVERQLEGERLEVLRQLSGGEIDAEAALELLGR